MLTKAHSYGQRLATLESILMMKIQDRWSRLCCSLDHLAAKSRLACLCLLLLSTSCWGMVADPLNERSYFVDKNAAFDIHSIEQAEFKPFAKRLNIGYELAPIWIRLRVTPGTQSASAADNLPSGHLVLRTGPHDVNQIDVYEFNNGEWRRRTAGDLYSDSETWCADDYYCFRLHDHSTQPKTLYLRIQTYNFLMFDSDVIALENIPVVSSNRMKRIAASLTMAAFLLAIGFYLLSKHRSKLTVVYVIFQISVLSYLLNIYGFPERWFPHLSASIIDAMPHLLFILRTLLMAVAVYVVIRPYCDAPLYPKLMTVVVVGCIVNFIAFFAGFKVFAIQFNLIIFAVQPTVHLYGLLTSKGMVKNVRILLYTGYLIYCVLLAGSIIPAMLVNEIGTFDGSVQNITDWRLNGAILGVFVILLIKFEEDYREKVSNEKLNQLQMDALEAKSSAALLADRNTLIDLLTHDLKNPLGTITFASRALREQLRNDPSATKRLTNIDLSVTRMNNLIEHVAVSTRVDRYSPPSNQLLSPALELIDELIENYDEPERFDVKVDVKTIFKADRDMLSVVFGNLIDNAYKYGHAAGKISIEVTSAQPRDISQRSERTAETQPEIVQVKISNTIGTFGAPDRERVFERYYRPSSTMNIPGMGLGLSLVKAAAAKIGATVHYSRDEETVTFSVEVPN
jgi:signal transduction histidine kinase